MVLGAPTENVNAPATGCESAETARQATTYVPLASVGTSVLIVSLPPSWRIAPTSTAVPSPATTRIESGTGSTLSLNVSTTWLGDVGSTAPDVGLVETSSAWALAAPHVPEQRAQRGEEDDERDDAGVSLPAVGASHLGGARRVHRGGHQGHGRRPGLAGFVGADRREQVGPSPRHAGADGADRAADHFGGLLVAEPDVLREEERLAPIGVQRVRAGRRRSRLRRRRRRSAWRSSLSSSRRWRCRRRTWSAHT